MEYDVAEIDAMIDYCLVSEDAMYPDDPMYEEEDR